jgi:hypothetical protein
LNEIKYRERIEFLAIKKEDIDPSPEAIISTLNLLKSKTWRKIKQIRLKQDSPKDGINYANQTQLYINSLIAIEQIKNRS